MTQHVQWKWTKTLSAMSRLCLLLSTTLVLSACLPLLPQTSSSSPQAQVGTTAIQFLKNETVVVLPVTSVFTPIQDMLPKVQSELLRQLRNANVNVYQLSDQQFQTLHSEAIKTSGSIYQPQSQTFIPLNYDAYVKALIVELQKTGSFDFLLMPELLLRNAAVTNKKVVAWDGQKEMLPVSVNDKSLKALSLKVSVYQKQGARLFYRYGGVTLPFAANNPKQLNPTLNSYQTMVDAVNIALTR